MLKYILTNRQFSNDTRSIHFKTLYLWKIGQVLSLCAAECSSLLALFYFKCEWKKHNHRQQDVLYTNWGNLDNMALHLISLVEILFIWVFQFRFSSMVNILAKNPYFFPTPTPNSGTLIFSLSFCFGKICNCHHQCHHFHLRFCWVLSIGWEEMIFCQKVGRRGVKH